MLTVSKDNVKILINYGFKESKDRRRLYKILMVKGKYVGEMYVDLLYKKNYYPVQLDVKKGSYMPNIIYYLIDAKLIEIKEV